MDGQSRSSRSHHKRKTRPFDVPPTPAPVHHTRDSPHSIASTPKTAQPQPAAPHPAFTRYHDVVPDEVLGPLEAQLAMKRRRIDAFQASTSPASPLAGAEGGHAAAAAPRRIPAHLIPELYTQAANASATPALDSSPVASSAPMTQPEPSDMAPSAHQWQPEQFLLTDFPELYAQTANDAATPAGDSVPAASSTATSQLALSGTAPSAGQWQSEQAMLMNFLELYGQATNASITLAASSTTTSQLDLSGTARTADQWQPEQAMFTDFPELYSQTADVSATSTFDSALEASSTTIAQPDLSGTAPTTDQWQSEQAMFADFLEQYAQAANIPVTQASNSVLAASSTLTSQSDFSGTAGFTNQWQPEQDLFFDFDELYAQATNASATPAGESGLAAASTTLAQPELFGIASPADQWGSEQALLVDPSQSQGLLMPTTSTPVARAASSSSVVPPRPSAPVPPPGSCPLPPGACSVHRPTPNSGPHIPPRTSTTSTSLAPAPASLPALTPPKYMSFRANGKTLVVPIVRLAVLPRGARVVYITMSDGTAILFHRARTGQTVATPLAAEAFAKLKASAVGTGTTYTCIGHGKQPQPRVAHSVDEWFAGCKSDLFGEAEGTSGAPSEPAGIADTRVVAQNETEFSQWERSSSSPPGASPPREASSPVTSTPTKQPRPARRVRFAEPEVEEISRDEWQQQPSPRSSSSRRFQEEAEEDEESDETDVPPPTAATSRPIARDRVYEEIPDLPVPEDQLLSGSSSAPVCPNCNRRHRRHHRRRFVISANPTGFPSGKTRGKAPGLKLVPQPTADALRDYVYDHHHTDRDDARAVVAVCYRARALIPCFVKPACGAMIEQRAEAVRDHLHAHFLRAAGLPPDATGPDAEKVLRRSFAPRCPHCTKEFGWGAHGEFATHLLHSHYFAYVHECVRCPEGPGRFRSWANCNSSVRHAQGGHGYRNTVIDRISTK